MTISTPITLLTPLSAGLSVTVTQGPGGATSHSGDLYCGWDFVTNGILGQSVLAVADGVVVFVMEDVPDGGTHQDLPGSGEARDPSLGPPGALGNVVTLEHNINGQQFYSSYLHLGQSSVPVSVGQSVFSGQEIGKVGNTGVRFGTHLHLNIGETLGSYRNAAGAFPAYQIAQGPSDGDALLPLINFIDAPPGTGGEWPVGSTSVSSTTVATNQPVYPAIELSDVELGVGGFVINGVSVNDWSGHSVSNAGDVNGDGLDDLIVGAPGASSNGAYSGSSYVVFGKSDGTAVELSAVESGTGGFAINGVSAYDISGSSVSNAGDVNGDGLDDLIVGAPGASSNGAYSGSSYVVFGKSDGTEVELSAVENGTHGFVIKGGSAFDRTGHSVSTAGDMNGDGFDDLIVGAPFDEPSIFGKRDPHYYAGTSYVVFGKSDSGVVELSTVESGVGGFVINSSAAFDRVGHSVGNAGDVNGDGMDDAIVGAYLDDPNGDASGASYVVFGKSDGTAVELSAVASGTGGFAINGVAAFDEAGVSVSAAGDVNGDGLDDLIVGAWLDAPNGDGSGASFVVFGKSDGTAVELSAVESGAGGFAINGVSAYDISGSSVSNAGDVNGDGLDDLIVGAFGDDPNGSSSGASFVVFGKGDGAAVELSVVEAGVGGFVINGALAYDKAGYAVSDAGDVNGDGVADLIVGAPGGDPNGLNSGASYVVFGPGGGHAIA